ncbi:MAG: YebC/PmpR family DNA-binding transcriptional regulator [Planctomycetota bacterium]|nr:YebC/PmpR family DNA-binding transcriptional regulator [Planctomycetota bacterium]
MGRMFEKRKETIFKRAGRVSKLFARISREIMMVVRAGGPSPEANPALRRAIQNARAANMPKDKVENAIRKASGADAIHYEEVVYEGYAPHGIALLIVTATDNPTRTVANVRMILNKNGGNLGAAGSVGFQFQRMGVFRLNAEGLDPDELELELIDHGLEDMLEGEDDDGNAQLILRCGFADVGSLQRELEAREIPVALAGMEYVCLAPVPLGAEEEREILELVDALEQDDDVQRIFHALA